MSLLSVYDYLKTKYDKDTSQRVLTVLLGSWPQINHHTYVQELTPAQMKARRIAWLMSRPLEGTAMPQPTIVNLEIIGCQLPDGSKTYIKAGYLAIDDTLLIACDWSLTNVI
jgi:hypothetical protein